MLTMAGGGLWQPDAEPLRKLRREIDRRSNRMKQVLTDERIRRHFLGGVSTVEEKVVKAFVGLTSNASTALKRHPKVSPKFLSARLHTLPSGACTSRESPSGKAANPLLQAARGLDPLAIHGSITDQAIERIRAVSVRRSFICLMSDVYTGAE